MAPTPLNDSLNAPRTRWGMTLPCIIALLLFAGVVGYYYGFSIGVAIAIGAPAASSVAVKLDQNIYRLAGISLSQKAHYHPAKRSR